MLSFILTATDMKKNIQRWKFELFINSFVFVHKLNSSELILHLKLPVRMEYKNK